MQRGKMASIESNGHRGDRPNRVRRTLVILLSLCTAIAAGTLALALGFRKPIAELLLLDELRRRTGETDNVAVSLTRLDRDHLALRSLRIGDALEIARLDAHYSPTGLFASRLDGISVSGLRLRGSLNTSGISFGPLDAMIDAPGADEPGAATSFPIDRIEMEDARIELVTPEGPLAISLDSRVTQKSPGRLEAAVSLGLEHRLATASATLTATGEPEKWTGQISMEAALSGDFGSSIHMGDLTLAARSAFAIEREQITIRSDECAQLRVDEFEIADGPRLIRPLEMCVKTESVSIDPNGESTVDLVVSIEPFAVELGDGLGFKGEIPQLNVRGRQARNGELSGSLTAARGFVLLPKTIGARGIHLGAHRSPASAARESATNAELRIDSLFDPLEPARFAELGMEASFVGVGASAGTPIEFDLEIADAERNIVVAIAGQHQPELGVGRASVRLPPFAFCPSGADLTKLLPILRGILNDAQGSIEAMGTLDWDTAGVRGKIDVALRDVKASTGAFDIEHLNAAVSLLESGTPPGQLLSIGRIGFGLELTGGEILFQLLPSGQIAIESAVWEFAGGELSTAGELDPFGDQQTLAFDVSGVDLGSLLEIVALDGLSGTGTLEGTLPLFRDGDRIEIRDAQLRSDAAGGTIRYQAEPGAASLGAADDQFGVLLQVLENFRYTRLSLAINGDAGGDVVVAIGLSGSNPDYQGGHLVDFNLSIESRLSDLILQETAAYQIPYLIEERFRAFSGPKVNLPPSPCVHPTVHPTRHPSAALDEGATQR
jgi:hypothetical protein